MNTKPVSFLSVVALGAMLAAPALAQEKVPSAFTTEQLTDRAIHRRAVEAVIWGMPAVNFERMLQAASVQGANSNQVVYWSKPVNAKNQTLTPNPDTIYLNPFYDTSKGPVVVEVPPATADNVIVGSFDTAWQNALADVGPGGGDDGRGGKYLITPPGYQDKAPEGYMVLPSETFRGFVILRSNFKSRDEADVVSAVNHGKRVKIYPLSGDASATVFVDAYDKPFDATIPYDATYFEFLNRFVQAEPWLVRDKVMIDVLKTLGIEKGKPFQPDARTQKIFADAAHEAHALIAMQYESAFAAAPFFPGTRWALPVPKPTIDGMSTKFAAPEAYPIDGRAIMYHMAYFSPKKFGGGQFYIMTIHDSAGLPLDGNKAYRLRVPPNAPLSQYWSVTVYDRETHALVKNMTRASRASNVHDLQKNPDGSVDVYFGPQAPSGKESNWVPTDPQRGFELLFRVYGPKPEFFEKTWNLPDVEKVK